MMATGIGTARLSVAYFRPRLEEINKDDVEKRIAAYQGREIDKNMWVLRTRKSYIYRGTYTTNVVIKRGDKYYIVDIPTDKNGLIRQVVMAERLLDTESGDREGHTRNVLIDCSVNALKKYDAKNLAKTYQWFLYPNETDVINIDDANTKLVEILNKGGKVKHSSKILITGGTPSDRGKIASGINVNFTNREKGIINNCLIEIAPDNRRYAGCFQGKTDAKGDIIGVPRIVVTKSYINNADVIVHECIHSLRQFDPKRDYRLQAVKRYWGQDADLEESLTEAETTGRKRPFKREVKAGYYHYIKIPNKTSSDLIVEDRVTITGDIEKGMKGKRMEKKLLLKYPLTNIAHLKIKGNAEAIDTFYRLDNPVDKTSQHIHLYNPRGTLQTDKEADNQLKGEFGGKIVQFQDGKQEVIQKSTKLPSSGRSRITPKRPRIG